MNIIGAWKAARENQEIVCHTVGVDDPPRITVHHGKDTSDDGMNLMMTMNHVSFAFIMSDCWEVVKETKKFLVERVDWAETSSDGLIYPLCPGGRETLQPLIGKPKMKMTLEWEE